MCIDARHHPVERLSRWGRHAAVVVVSLAGLLAAPAQGSLLGLTLLRSPDITSGFIDVAYDAGTGFFTASGFALTLDGTNFDVIGGFDYSIQLDGFGGLISNPLNILTITGALQGEGPTVVTLLEGVVTDFGFQDGGGDLFEILFTVTGGSLATPAFYGDPGAVGGVIMNANGSNFGGTFDVDFNNNGGFPGFGQGTSDTAPIPGPATLVLLAMAGGLVARRRRRR